MKKSDDELVEKYKYLVYFLAKKLYNKRVEFDDLVQAGFMGLLKAITKKNNDNSFSAYASKYIIYEMKQELRKTSLFKVSDYLYKLSIKVNKLKEDDIYEIAEKCRTSIENVLLIKSLGYNCIDKIEDFEIIDDSNYKIPIDLDKDEEEVYKMRVLYQYSQKEIATALNISQSKVSRIIKRIVEKL